MHLISAFACLFKGRRRRPLGLPALAVAPWSSPPWPPRGGACVRGHQARTSASPCRQRCLFRQTPTLSPVVTRSASGSTASAPTLPAPGGGRSPGRRRTAPAWHRSAAPGRTSTATAGRRPGQPVSRRLRGPLIHHRRNDVNDRRANFLNCSGYQATDDKRFAR